MESLSDIVAQMRGRGEDGRMDRRLWLDYADRIEAAAKRHTPGNAAELRKALERVVEIADREWNSFRETPAMKEMRDVCTSALSAPPRQCDVGTAEEQAQRFHNFCVGNSSGINGMCKPTCPCIDCFDKCQCLTKWAQTPYWAKEKGDCDGE